MKRLWRNFQQKTVSVDWKIVKLKIKVAYKKVLCAEPTDINIILRCPLVFFQYRLEGEGVIEDDIYISRFSTQYFLISNLYFEFSYFSINANCFLAGNHVLNVSWGLHHLSKWLKLKGQGHVNFSTRSN